MKTIIRIILFSFFVLIFSKSTIYAQNPSRIYFFYGNGCPHCAVVEQFLGKNRFYDIYPIQKMEIYFSRENALAFTSLMDELDIPEEKRGVPAMVFGKTILVGDRPIIDQFKTHADLFMKETDQIVPTVKPQPIVEKNVDRNLTIFAVIAGALVDAINPCEFAVLILLMTTVLASGNAKKALLSGFAFSLSIFISYFLMGLGLYSAIGMGNVAHIFYTVIGWLAIVLGLLNLKDYFWYGKGFLMEVPLSWRPNLKKLIHSVTNPIGAFATGFLVSLFLLPSTSGPYIIILGMLAKKTQLIQAILYLLVYNLIFISPMVFISYAVYRGYDPHKAEEIRQKRLRTLHLIAGLIMLGMGIVVLMGWV